MAFTPHAKTVDALLRNQFGYTLQEFLDKKREQGTSYEQIAKQLLVLTESAVDVTGATIRNWLIEEEVAS